MSSSLTVRTALLLAALAAPLSAQTQAGSAAAPVPAGPAAPPPPPPPPPPPRGRPRPPPSPPPPRRWRSRARLHRRRHRLHRQGVERRVVVAARKGRRARLLPGRSHRRLHGRAEQVP